VLKTQHHQHTAEKDNHSSLMSIP